MSSRQTLADVGEFGAIDLLRRVLREEGAEDRSARLGIGDDAAVFSIEPGREIVATCDIQICGRHFLPAIMSAREIGARAMTVNLSDLAAMGARPERALISLALPGSFLVEDLRDLYRGMSDCLVPHRAVVSGGNLAKVSEPDAWFLDITLLGTVPSGRAVSRGGARPGEIIAMTGTPGASAAGLALVRRMLGESAAGGSTQAGDAGSRPSALLGSKVDLMRAFLADRPWAGVLLGAHLRPRARIEAGQALVGIASAMVDVSDGWRSDLMHLCEASSVRAQIDRPLPLSEAMEEAGRYLGIATEAWQYGPSDDYELLFTVPEHRWAEAERALAATGTSFARIGSMIEGEPGLDLDPGGFAIPSGWDHFDSD